MSKTVLSRKAAVAQGALLVYLRPKLAQDAKIDLTPILAKITKDNFKDSKPSIITALAEQTKGKLAKDMALDDAGTLLDSIEALNIAEDEEKKEEAKGEDEWPDKDDEKETAKDKKKSAKDADPDDEDDEEEKKKKAEAKDKAKGAKDCDPDDKKAMDAIMKQSSEINAKIAAAIKTATDSAVKTQREIRDAERAVRPYVGDLAMAHDSADAVYRTALDAMGIKTEGINELIALKTILEMQPKSSDPKPRERMAMDAAGAKSFAEMFPDAARIRLM